MKEDRKGKVERVASYTGCFGGSERLRHPQEEDPGMQVPSDICPGSGLTGLSPEPLGRPTEHRRAREAARKEPGVPPLGANRWFTFCGPSGCCEGGSLMLHPRLPARREVLSLDEAATLPLWWQELRWGGARSPRWGISPVWQVTQVSHRGHPDHVL